MISLSHSPYSHIKPNCFTVQLIDDINRMIAQHFPPLLETDYPNAEFEITFYPDGHQDQDAATNTLVNLFFSYDVPDAPNKQETVALNGTIHQAKQLSARVLHHVIAQRTCTHDWVRPLSKHGTPFPDGRKVCVHCERTETSGLPVLAGRQVATSMGGDYVTQHDWGGGIKLQCGEKGLVLGADTSYTTAFFEAFPTYDGHGAFLRGEGSNLVEAEQRAWEKHQRILACPEHEWTRVVRGEERTDGYATCTRCALCTDALAPTTSCSVCQRPTTREMGDGRYLCPTHYHELDIKTQATELLRHYTLGASKDQPALMRRFEFQCRIYQQVNTAFLQAIGADAFDKHEHQISRLGSHLRALILFNVHQLRIADLDTKCPDGTDAQSQACVQHFCGNIDKFLLFLTGEVATLPNSLFLPENYFIEDGDTAHA